MTNHPCWILGVLDSGPDSLTPAACRLLQSADLVLGETRFLELFHAMIPSHALRRSMSGQLKELPSWIESARLQGQRVVVLATGDPLFSGIAGHLSHKIPIENLRVLAAATTPQLAFSRLMLPWTQARFVTLHASDNGDWHPTAPATHPFFVLIRLLPNADLIAVLTSPANTPSRIARMLLQLELDKQYLMSVAEQLETPQERVVRDLTPDQVAKEAFANPNVVILQRRKETSPPDSLPVMGLPESCFLPQKDKQGGLITKQEVRVIVLAHLALRPESIVWDLGAGSGSVGLEAARLCPKGWVWAVEKDAGRARQIRANRVGLGVVNYTLLEARAMEVLETWPDPDAIFIGGSGGELTELLDSSQHRLRPGGRLVLALVTLEHLSSTLTILAQSGWSWLVTQVQINHSRPLLDLHRLVPDAPVWVVTANRENACHKTTITK